MDDYVYLLCLYCISKILSVCSNNGTVFACFNLVHRPLTNVIINLFT